MLGGTAVRVLVSVTVDPIERGQPTPFWRAILSSTRLSSLARARPPMGRCDCLGATLPLRKAQG
jgi:hypothetical protein